MRRVGQDAAPILRMAHCLATGKEIVVSTPHIPVRQSYAMFDVEGLPPHLDELEKTYLWGGQVYGAKPGPCYGATAGFDKQNDREGWEQFLGNARAIFDEYGDLPSVHWHHYERVRLDMYVHLHGTEIVTVWRPEFTEISSTFWRSLRTASGWRSRPGVSTRIATLIPPVITS